MAVTNQRTVTIKMTRRQALKLCILIDNHVSCLQRDNFDKIHDIEGLTHDWIAIHDKVRAGVDALDQKEAESGRPFTQDPTE